jgi:hypothetical protein
MLSKSQYEWEIKSLEKDIKYRIEEVVDWYEISMELEGNCKYSPKDHNAHEPAYLLQFFHKKKSDLPAGLTYKHQSSRQV